MDDMNVITQRLRTKLGRTKAERSAIVSTARREQRSDPNEHESRQFRRHSSEIDTIVERLDDRASSEQRSARVDDAYRRASGYEPSSSVYGPEQRNSCFADLTAVARGGDYEASSASAPTCRSTAT